MRLNDMLTESQINELGIIDKIGSGIKGAVSNVQAGRSQRQGEEHSNRIVANLKSEFMKMVGGGHQATYKNLIDFLGSNGLTDLDSIPDPNTGNTVPPSDSSTSAEPAADTTTPPANTASPADPDERKEPTLEPEEPAHVTTPDSTGIREPGDPRRMTSPTQTVEPTPTKPTAPSFGGQGYSNVKMNAPTGMPTPQMKTFGTPQATAKAEKDKAEQERRDRLARANGLREDTETPLRNGDIDKIISAAVKKNYAKIVSAQRGRTTSTPAPASAAQPSINGTNIFSDPDKLAGEWAAYIASGGRINRKLRKLIASMQTSLAVPASAKPEETKPAEDETMSINGQKLDPNNPDDARMIAQIKAQNANESVGYSRFLGIQL